MFDCLKKCQLEETETEKGKAGKEMQSDKVKIWQKSDKAETWQKSDKVETWQKSDKIKRCRWRKSESESCDRGWRAACETHSSIWSESWILVRKFGKVKVGKVKIGVGESLEKWKFCWLTGRMVGTTNKRALLLFGLACFLTTEGLPCSDHHSWYTT